MCFFGDKARLIRTKELLQNNMHICVGFLFESADEKS